MAAGESINRPRVTGLRGPQVQVPPGEFSDRKARGQGDWRLRLLKRVGLRQVGSRCGALLLASACVTVSSCEEVPSVRTTKLSNGWCEATNKYLNDDQFVEIILREQEADLWRDGFAAPADFVDKNPKCCVVIRYRRQEDWPDLSEADPEGLVERRMERNGPSRYLVFVGLTAKDRRGDERHRFYLVNSCGQVVLPGGYTLKM